jgi:cytochrome c oxidase subunit 1
MAITYLLVPLIFRRELMFRKLAQWQPYVFGIGVAGISLFMMGAGTLGVARRHWDMTFADAPLPFDYPSAAFLMMGLNGLFAVLAALGGIMFITVVVGSVFFGRKLGKDEVPDYPEVPPQAEAVGHYGSAGTLRIPGTAMLVGIFFVAFVLYYFVNWKYLSEVWPLS